LINKAAFRLVARHALSAEVPINERLSMLDSLESLAHTVGLEEDEALARQAAQALRDADRLQLELIEITKMEVA